MATRKRKQDECPPWLKSALERLDDMLATASARVSALEAASRLNSFASARPGAVESSANVRPDAAKKHALLRWWEEEPNVPTTRLKVSMPAPDYIEKLNKALNGNFGGHDEGAENHPGLLTLSVVSRLEKKVDALERAVRFLVERAPGA